MEYDSENRIREVTDGANNFVSKYWYDDQGFRVRKLARKDVDGEERRIEVLYPSMYFGIEQQRRTVMLYSVKKKKHYKVYQILKMGSHLNLILLKS